MGKVHRRRLVAVVVLSAVIGPALPASAHGGYHHSQVIGTAGRKGIWWMSEVTNPSVPAVSGNLTADHFVAPAWLIDPATSTTCGGQKFIEMGWGERGDLLLENGNPFRFIYGFDSNSCAWIFAAGVRLDPGQSVEFYMEPGVGCSPGTGQCTWFRYYRTGFEWLLLSTVTIGIGNDAYPELGTEVQNYGSESHWQIAGSEAGYEVDLWYAHLRHGNGNWYYWTNSELSAIEVEAPAYPLTVQNQWHRFWTERA